MRNPRLLRITTVPLSLHLLLKGQFQFMQSRGFELLTASADGKEVKEIVKGGVNHIAIPFTRRITLLRDFWCLLLLIRLIRRFKPDIVHTHTPKAGLLGMVAAWFCRVPIRMHTVAGLPMMETTGLKRWVLLITERITMACAHQIYPNSTGLMNYLTNELGFGKEKMNVLGKGSSNGIDTRYFKRSDVLVQKAVELRDEYQIRSDETVFSFVGRVVRDKGLVELITAFTEAGKNHHIRLFIVGQMEHDLDPIPDPILQVMRNDSRIVISGFQEDVRPWIVASDVFVFPSYREGFPNVVLQACALETVCIVTDINGCNEIIEDEVTGVIVKPKDSDDLKRGMEYLLMHPALRSQFADLACRQVSNNFDQLVFWNELENEYRRLLKSRVPKSH